MCIVAIVQDIHPDFPIIICANRDEAVDRESLPPEDNGFILCTRDLRSQGTCIGLNTITGTFATTTNIGRGGQPGYNRGKLVMQFLEDPLAALPLLRKGHCYCGFNLAWLNLYDTSIPTPVNWCSNRDPEAENSELSYVVHSIVDGQKVVIVANDMVGDEFVKSPFLEQGIHNILKKVPASSNNSEIPHQVVENLRDDLGSLLCSKQSPPSLVNWLSKLFWFSKKRRFQPGLQTLCWSFAALLLSFSLLLTFVDAFLLSFILAFFCGAYHHSKLNNLFTVLDVPGVKWGTISQTIIIKTRTGRVYYFYRDTVEKNEKHAGVAWKVGDWIEFRVVNPTSFQSALFNKK